MASFENTSINELVVAGGDSGVKLVCGELTGPDTYDTGGSIVDLSDYASDEVRSLVAMAQGATHFHCQFVPGASNGAALGKIAVFDADGAQIANGAVSLAAVVFDFIAIVTDA